MYTDICTHLSFQAKMYDESITHGPAGLQTVEYQRKRKAVEFIMPNFVPCDQHLCHMHDLRVAQQQRNCAAERLQKLQETTLVMIMIAVG